MAAQSRQNETEADELGCKLAGMACFDTKRGVEAFRKMAETDERMDGSYSKLSMMNSHPPSAARYEVLRSLSDTENYQQYSYCNTLGRRIKRAMAKK
jgi:Zn-dependent protease with chaperone function